MIEAVCCLQCQYFGIWAYPNRETGMNLSGKKFDFGLPVFEDWLAAVNMQNMEALMQLYNDKAMMIPAFSTRIRRNKYQIQDLYQGLFAKRQKLQIIPFQVSSQKIDQLEVDSGQLKITWNADKPEDTNDLRFSFIIKEGEIMGHHESLEPGEIAKISQLK